MFTIWKKPYLSFFLKLKMTMAVKLLYFLRFIDGRFFRFSSISFMGFRIYYRDFNDDMFWTVRETFIHDDYYFDTNKSVPVVFDCGGNIGISIMYFKFLYPNCRIISFEPHPENAGILKKNIKINKIMGVEFIQKAVGSREETLELFGNKRAATVMTNLREELEGADIKVGSGVYLVDSVPLSDYVNEEIDYLKMDIEGVEEEVIEGLNEKGKLKFINQIGMEYHRFDERENRLSKILALLEDNHFTSIFYSDKYSQYKFPAKKYYNFMVTSKKN